ncbi:MAG: hypothetical protein R2867_29635 [Caldilineaceae bacterium]
MVKSLALVPALEKAAEEATPFSTTRTGTKLRGNKISDKAVDWSAVDFDRRADLLCAPLLFMITI